MQDRPSAAELVLAVKEHLEREVIPSLADPRARFQTLVAAHVLGVVSREILAGDALPRAELEGLRALAGEAGAPLPATAAELSAELQARNRALAAAIRAGEAGDPAALVRHLRAVILAKLAIANPGYRSLAPREGEGTGR